MVPEPWGRVRELPGRFGVDPPGRYATYNPGEAAIAAQRGSWAKRAMRRESRMTEGPSQLENLLPLAAYDSDETGYWVRTGIFTGILFGVGMGVLPLISPFPTGRSLGPLGDLLLPAMAGLALASCFRLR